MGTELFITLTVMGLLVGAPAGLNATGNGTGDFFAVPGLAADNRVDYQAVQRLPVNANKAQPPKKISDSLGVEINGKAAGIIDVESGVTLWEKSPHRKLPIASITKLMTAAVFLENNPGWKKSKAFEGDENDVIGAKFVTGSGVAYTLEDMFGIMLTGSANNAARAMAHATGMDGETFVASMNNKAAELGMQESFFKEPTGLSHENISTARDLARLATHVFQNKKVRLFTSTKEHRFRATNADEERTVKATNDLIKTYLDEAPYDIVASKTGYTEEAGFCLIQQTKMAGKGEVLVVLLGSETEQQREQDMKALTHWAFENHSWEDVP